MTRKPPRLTKGDRVAIIAPGAAFNNKKFRAGIAKIKEMGLVPVFSPHLFKKDFIFAGTVSQRLADIRWAFQNDFKVVWCVRGGYGTYAVAEELSKLKRPAKPKLVLGHSDIFALQMICMQNWNWPALHGPLVDRIGKAEVTKREVNVVRETLLNPRFRLEVKSGLSSLGKKGDVRGIMTGGNLAMAASSLKTNWEIQTENKILFLEEIGERAYRIDRMLFQLQAAGKLSKLKAVVIGDFTECREPDGKNLVPAALKRYFGRAPYPILFGVHSGHGALRLSLPLGVRVRVRTKGKPLFQVLEEYAE